MYVNIDERGLKKVTKELLKLPGIFTKARKSALSSTGWFIRQELRNHVEYGGSGNWPKLHPLTAGFKKKKNVNGQWMKRSTAPTPMFWLGKFARYRVDNEGTIVQIDFGKSFRGQPGTVDPTLKAVAIRTEKGERISVTDAMRKKFGFTRRKRPKKQTSGETYFPLKKTTKTLEIPKRPAISQVWKKVKPKIPAYFEKKFYKALDRYMTGAKK